jgi:hypothetical protein
MREPLQTYFDLARGIIKAWLRLLRARRKNSKLSPRVKFKTPLTSYRGFQSASIQLLVKAG